MGLFDIFKRKKESERFEEKQRERKDISVKKPAHKKTGNKKTEKTDNKEIMPPADNLKKSKIAESILYSPHVTEKSTYLSDGLKRGKSSGGHYVFKIKEDANKPSVKRAVEESYGVKVDKVRIISGRKKSVFMRGVKGIKSEHKKALVILKKGDKIEFV